MKKEIKHIYLVGNKDEGFRAYSYDEELADLYCKQRKNRYKYKKVKYKKVEKHLEYNTEEITQFPETDITLTLNDEIYLIESVDQYMLDMFVSSNNVISRFVNSLSYLRIKDKDKLELIKELIRLLETIRNDYMTENNGISGWCWEDSEEEENILLIDTYKIVKYFINNIL